MNNVKVDSMTFNALMLNKKRFVVMTEEVTAATVGGVMTFEREDGSSTLRRQVTLVEKVGWSYVASIAPVSGGAQ